MGFDALLGIRVAQARDFVRFVFFLGPVHFAIDTWIARPIFYS